MTAPTRGVARLRVGACLSLSGQFARFGVQAAHALHTWADWHGHVDLVIEDDHSSRAGVEARLPGVAGHCDVLLGPYSTHLARRAAHIAAQEGWLVWNHGGSGDDIHTDYPGHVVSILTPTSRYADPYLHRLATPDNVRETPLWIVAGPGSFARHITTGAQSLAARLGITARVVTTEEFTNGSIMPGEEWCLLSVGRFEDDIATTRHAQALTDPPRMVCSIAAGVREFADHISDPDGVYGIAQWFPGNGEQPRLGPSETDFLSAYTTVTGATPDYPAIQAVAGAIIAEHCATHAGTTTRDALWGVAAELDTTTLFGGFHINPTTGAQDLHSATLLRWRDGQPRWQG